MEVGSISVDIYRKSIVFASSETVKHVTEVLYLWLA